MVEKKMMLDEYKKIAEFLGYSYFPFSKEMGVQNQEYPGWYDTSGFDNLDGRLLTYKSPLFLYRKVKDFNFRYDWNNLLKVIIKIESIESSKYGGFNVDIERDCCVIYSRHRSKDSAYSRSYCGGGHKMKAVYNNCLAFIDWYNDNFETNKEY